jgi:hypothetical protein
VISTVQVSRFINQRPRRVNGKILRAREGMNHRFVELIVDDEYGPTDIVVINEGEQPPGDAEYVCGYETHNMGMLCSVLIYRVPPSTPIWAL